MAVTLIVRSGGASAPPSITLDAPRIVIGRGEGCEVRLPDPSVSHRHASLRQRGAEWLLVDEGSTNGTHVGSVRLAPQSPRVLRGGDLIRVGRVWLEIRLGPRADPAELTLGTRELALALVEEALASEGQGVHARVRVVSGPDAGKELALRDRTRAYVIGRTRDADLVVDDADASRRHAEIRRRGVGIVVRDLGSKNGVILGGTLLAKGQERSWLPGVPLVAGGNTFELEDPVAAALAELEAAVDEPLAPEEPIPPPGEAPDAPSPDELLPEALPLRGAERPAAPRVEAPRVAHAVLGAASRPGWAAADYLVLLLALAVLAASGAGLWWLFRLN